ncbi:heavy metal translocating P-type ATPase [Maritalea mediterranea]|uniref:Cadmium-translocating P-type ATPase n=1 Tax=Maritalea mediterranea TaxID=2909667 RepID=A0ABS9EB03_9HYPH|nr:heavy metal translocating P-type ATPase [Maritalea mediterranea]MCF4099943.1 cadmium-translocating P-type ATPase [Maritalea mediterranea]
MSCCAPGVEAGSNLIEDGASQISNEAIIAASADLGDGQRQVEFGVPDMYCAACIKSIEAELNGLEMVSSARVNMSTKRVKVIFSAQAGAAPMDLVAAIGRAGYRSFLLDVDEAGKDKSLSKLILALAVAGFAAMNIMLFSVSIWSGANESTRDLFHWISALIAVPTVFFSGQVFYKSAWGALRQGRLNMDVPISLAVLLALALSLYETINSGEHAYFDASVSLLFFLLIGRTLDHVMRERARSAVRSLASLAPKGAVQILANGQREFIKLNDVQVGMVLEVAAGERIPVDGRVIEGKSELDMSLVTGETVPELCAKGSAVLGGATNLSGALKIEVEKAAHQSFLARMIELMDAAEGSRAGFKRIADRAAEIYAPFVHLLALFTFIGWGLYNGDWYHATVTAIAVLIITCPCALALAVPIVHVVAAGRLFERGVMMKDGAALERLAQVTKIAFDKTGTLSLGTPIFHGQIFGDDSAIDRALQLAQLSRHPFSKAFARAFAGRAVAPLKDAEEMPGAGVEAHIDGQLWRWGRADFCDASYQGSDAAQSEVYLSCDGKMVAGFGFEDMLRPDAHAALADLKAGGYDLAIFSGDRKQVVASVAKALGVAEAHGALTPDQKVEAIAESGANEKILMVGDGINDAPALRAAHVSMAPSSAADVGRNAADFIFTHNRLTDVHFALEMSKRASRAVVQNFGLALCYNAVAIPLAVMGFATPLLAAIAMSSSSVIVTLNALRLRLGQQDGTKNLPAHSSHAPQMEPVAAE